MKAKEEIKMKMENSYGVSFVSTFVRDLVISLIFYPKKKEGNILNLANEGRKD